jgi:membrane-bound metal-dependent hydrolase YbcI (DUF457 family)
MDSITHGLTGALLGKAYLAEPRRHAPGSSERVRIVVLGATLSSIFPDIDVFDRLFTGNDLAIIQTHRGVTHSFVGLPVFAVLLATLLYLYARGRRKQLPPWSTLALACAVGLASHIVLDLITSFGTMVWSPVSHTRAAWDLVFIIDFTLTAIVLLPQTLAWVYREPARHWSRATHLWLLFTLLAVGVNWLTRAAAFPFPRWAVVALSAVFAALFFLPAWRGRGFRLRRSSWNRAGVCALASYLLLCAMAHHAAFRQVERFAASHALHIEQMGAMPLPPSAAHWDGLIRTPEGVYEARIHLLGSGEPNFRYIADHANPDCLDAAKQLPKVQIYLWFARFPVFHCAEEGSRKVVEISDLRFFRRRRSGPSAFTFQVTFDAAGRVVEEGWATPEP